MKSQYKNCGCLYKNISMAMIVNFKFIVISLVVRAGSSDDFEPFLKCCNDTDILNDQFECMEASWGIATSEMISRILFNTTDKIGKVDKVCLKHGKPGRMITGETRQDGDNDTCVDILANGTKVKLFCDARNLVDSDSNEQCDSLFTQLHFYGATIVVFATIIYNIPFIIVVVIYCFLPELRYRAYDRAVSNYNTCYAMINFLLIILGLYNLCHANLSIVTYRLFGLCIMFWVQGAVIWLFIICFDMTLVITRFHWAPKGGPERGQEEKRKRLIYAVWGWGFSSFLTLIAAIVEFTPMLPENSPFRPNFHKIDETNVPVIVYVITGPVLICIIDTCLFIYTTIKTIAAQKSTAISHQNHKNHAKKKYFVFLKLYLLMDTPWLTGALGAIYQDLWTLKFIKIIQPILIIVLIVPRKRIIEAIKCSRVEINQRETVRPRREKEKKCDDRTTTKRLI